MKNVFKNINIYKKITLTFVVFVFIPSLIINFYSYRQIDSYVKNEYIQSRFLSLQQTKSSIDGKIRLVESVANSICYNNNMIDFLDHTYKPKLSLDEYRYEVKPIVEYALLYHKVNISNILIFMKEKSIPEGYGMFYHEDNIIDQEWLEEFKKSSDRTAWIQMNDSQFDNTYYQQMKDSFLYIHKIMTLRGNYLGLCVISMQPQDIFLEDNMNTSADSEIYFADSDGTIIYSWDNMIKEVFELSEEEKGNFNIGDELYIYNTIHSIDKKIIMKIPSPFLKNITKKVRLSSYLIFLTNILLIAMFYYMLRKIFVKINKNIRLMNYSIKNNFKKRIPVETKDEIGQMSEQFNILLDKIDILVQDMIEKQVAHKNTQLKALQYQINPHFIYNTLGIFAGKMELEGLYDVSEAMTDFSNMLRYTIKRKSPYTSLKNEINYVKSYISLQQIKYENSIQLIVHLPDYLKEYRIINFILQPIVENSIMHGLDTDEDKPLRITINCTMNSYENRDTMKIEIIDNGLGIHYNDLEKLNEQLRDSNYSNIDDENMDSIGLKNINERLKLFYGNEYYIRVYSKRNELTKFVITIPLNKIDLTS